MREVVIASACRLATGRFQGSLTPLRAPELGAAVIKEAVKRAGIEPEHVEEVIMGNVVTAGLGQNPARQALIYSGLPNSIGAFTINKVCGSSLKAVALAAQAIKAGDAEIIVAGGQESMTNTPYILPDARFGARLGNKTLVDSMINDGLWDIYNDYHMGITGELVVEKYGLTREQLDKYSYNSHLKALAAMESGKFKDEIIPVEVPQGKKKPPVMFDTDEGPRKESTFEKLSTLRPAFKKDGAITAGNASSINDGAAACVVMSAEKAEAMNIKPMARITGYATGGLEPKWVMMAPVEAVKNLLKKTGEKISEFGLFEVNEAFSSQAIAVSQECGMDLELVNVHGGAIALGHPIGASGARILTTLLYAMKDRGVKKGIATLCLGGGNAVAMSVESLM